MKTWTHVKRFVEGSRLPYRVEGETLVSPDGRILARTVQGVHDILSAPGHPDSKRQERCKRRDLARYGARRFKMSKVVYTPMLEREEPFITASFVAARLLGREYAA